jgi:hypothetical protein
LRWRPWTRMHDDKAQSGWRHVAITLRSCDLPHDALPRPPAARVGLGPPGCVHPEGQSGLRLAPRFPLWTHGPGPWHQGPQAQSLRQTETPRAALDALRSATMPWTPASPRLRPSSRASGVSTRSLVCPSHTPIRRGTPPSPLTPRLRSTWLRAARPSVLCPEAGRAASGVGGSSA